MKYKISLRFAFIFLLGIISLNGFFIVSSNHFTDINLKSIAFAQAEEGEIKYVHRISCVCSDGGSGFSLDCKTEKSDLETCTSDPLTHCYKVKWNGTIVMCD
jgi:hypothetical protein